MKKWIWVLPLLLMLTAVPVSAQDYTTPQEPDSVTDLLPEDRDSFGEGLRYVLRSAFAALQPEIAACAGISATVIGAALLISVLSTQEGKARETVRLVGIVGISCLLLSPADTLVLTATDTIHQISEYGKLLLPVMTAALAAQGGSTASAALYTATVTFDAVLTGLISAVLVPMVYIYLVLAVVHGAVGDSAMKRMRDLVKSAMTWVLKSLLYVFTGYIGITGIVSGTTDQSLLKAAKMTISGAVPVVGSILSDASEALLVSAGVVKNTVGIGGMLVVIAITIVPFLQIGLQYLILKLTAAVCGLFCDKAITDLIGDFSGAMGFLLGMTGAVCLIFLISLVCFLKGMG